MRKTISILSALVMLALAGSVYAQYPEKFTKDQADSTINLRRSQIKELEIELKQTNDAIEQAKADIAQRQGDITKCWENLYALCGTDRNGYNAYRERLARAEQEMNALRSMSPAQLSAAKGRVDALEALG
jgi:chromosome segregation ATPase